VLTFADVAAKNIVADRSDRAANPGWRDRHRSDEQTVCRARLITLTTILWLVAACVIALATALTR
jgi:hypothetical protein